MTTYAEAKQQGRNAVGKVSECPYTYEEHETLHEAWWNGFEDRLAEMEADARPRRRYESTEAHLHYYETRDD